MSDPPPLEPAPSGSGTRLGGTLLLAIGALIAGLCGLCTLGVSGEMLVDMSRARSAEDASLGIGILLFVLVVGGVSTGLGLLVAFAGLMIRRKPR